MLPLSAAIEVTDCPSEDEFATYSLPTLACDPSSGGKPRPKRRAKTARPPIQWGGGREGARAWAARRLAMGRDQTDTPRADHMLDPWTPVSPPREAFQCTGKSATSRAASSFSVTWSSSISPPSLFLDSLTEVCASSSSSSKVEGVTQRRPGRWLLSDAFMKRYMFGPGRPLGKESRIPSLPSGRSSPVSRKPFKGGGSVSHSPAPSLYSIPGPTDTPKSPRRVLITPDQGASPRPGSAPDVPSLDDLRQSVQQERALWLGRRGVVTSRPATSG